MMSNQTRSAYAAFEWHLKDLAVDGFPVGKGSWRNNLKWNSDLLEEVDDDAQLFTDEGLKELNQTIPFQKDRQWGPNAFHIQELIIEEKTKEKVKKNIHKYFKKLRLVDEHITHMDESMLQFTNLNELVLSANLIETVDISCLPQKLKVLELCGNNIADLSTLYAKPLHLQHLGLSHNQIEKFLKPPTTIFWKSLLSLDLSCNYLIDLRKTVNILVLIPKLKSLLLFGNPLYFSMGYHGFIIGSFPSLTLLDDHRITADERYHFNGFTEQQDLNLDVVSVIMRLDQLENLPYAVETETFVEYPKPSTTYHVEFDFIDDCKIREDEKLDQSDNIIVTTANGGDNEMEEGKSSVSVIKSNEMSWNGCGEPLFNCNKTASSNDFRMFHEYCGRRVVLRLVENKLLVSNEPKPTDMEKKDLLTAESASTSKEKTKSVGKGGSKASASVKDDQGKPKGKSALKKDIELFEWSRSSKIIATCEVDIDSLLHDVTPVKRLCTFENMVVDAAPVIHPNAPVDTISKKDAPQEAKKKSKDAGRAKGKAKQEVEEMQTICEGESEPKYVSLQFHMEVLRWMKTTESCRQMNK